jgi:hypothetical protein
MMLSRWVSFGRLQVGLIIHLHPTPLDDPTSLFVLDNSDLLIQNLSEPQKSQAECIMRYFSWRPSLLELEQCLEQCHISPPNLPDVLPGEPSTDEVSREPLQQAEDTNQAPRSTTFKKWAFILTVVALVAHVKLYPSNDETPVPSQSIGMKVELPPMSNETPAPPRPQFTEVAQKHSLEIVSIIYNTENHLADALHELAGFSVEQAKAVAANVAKVQSTRGKLDSPPQLFTVNLTRGGAARLKSRLGTINAQFTITPENLSQNSE